MVEVLAFLFLPRIFLASLRVAAMVLVLFAIIYRIMMNNFIVKIKGVLSLIVNFIGWGGIMDDGILYV